MEFVPKTSENLHILMWLSAQESLIVMLTSFPQLPSLHGCNRVWLTNVYEKCTNKEQRAMTTS
jgi:hypothetical protein